MPRTDRHIETLWWCLLGSAILHATLGTVFVRYAASYETLHLADFKESKRDPDPSAPAPRTPRQPRIALGREDSTADSLTWIGFRESTEHLAPQSEVEQSAMSRGNPAPQSVEPSPAEPSEPAEQARERTAEASAAVPPAQATAPAEAPAKASATPATEATAPHPTVPAAQQVPTAPPSPSPAPAEASTDKPAPAPEHVEPIKNVPLAVQPPQRRAPEPVAARPKRPKPGDSIPGLPSDRESLAAAIKGAQTLRPGKVAASRGLDVKTVAPRWSYTTTSTQRPRNPTIYVVFGRDGKVKDADFVRDGGVRLDSGSEEVNEPLLTAIYSWTASGKPLRDLPADDPGAGVTLLFTILLGP